jgi:hypothetical protein
MWESIRGSHTRVKRLEIFLPLPISQLKKKVPKDLSGDFYNEFYSVTGYSETFHHLQRNQSGPPKSEPAISRVSQSTLFQTKPDENKIIIT